MSQTSIQEDRKKLMAILQEIVKKCELDALAVVTMQSADSVAFFSEIKTNVEIFCTLSASLNDLSSMVTNKMNHGMVKEMIVIGSEGFTIMSPVKDKYILIGAGKDFFSLNKTVLILREKAKDLPLTLTGNEQSKRKACNHFCQNDDLYCCVCGKKIELCELCENSVESKQKNQNGK